MASSDDTSQSRLLLCSASPRRRELLAQLGLAFTALAPQIDERRRAEESPPALAERLAREKALAGLAQHQRARAAEVSGGGAASGAGEVVALAADTVVALGELDLG